MDNEQNTWDWEINAKQNSWLLNIREVLSYRHLILSLVRKDFLLKYTQTILGPVWMLFIPVVTLITYVLVFGNIVGVQIENLPLVLFYFSGIILWNFFNDSLLGSSNIFTANKYLFSKVYFPRVVMSISAICGQFLQLLINLVLLFLLIAFYSIFKGFSPNYSWFSIAFPLSIVLIGVISFSLGLIFSVLTAKYRDLSNLVGLLIRLVMFVTPILYPLSSVPPKLLWIVNLNPLTPLFEAFRLAVLGVGTFSPFQLGYSIVFAMVLFFISLPIFNRYGNTLIDVI